MCIGYHIPTCHVHSLSLISYPKSAKTTFYSLHLFVDADHQGEGIANLNVFGDSAFARLSVEDLHGGPGHGGRGRERGGAQGATHGQVDVSPTYIRSFCCTVYIIYNSCR
jgi:hypothetical protein